MMEEFSLEDVDALRSAARAIRALVLDTEAFENPSTPGRWRELRSEPDDLLLAFSTLTLRPGHELRAYVYQDFWGSHGVALAGEQGAEFPEPEDAEAERERRVGRGLCDDFMQAIAGDGSPRSCLEATVFAREVEELGAFWHGMTWGNETVLGGDPWSPPPPREPLAAVDQWVWLLDRPSSFNPTVTRFEGSSVVRFFSHDPLGREMIYANIDLYPGGEGLAFARYRAPIAIGPAGFIP